MALVQDYIQKNGLDAFSQNFSMHIGHHPTLPLIVINYHSHETKRLHPLVKQCRGLILEKDTWKVIAQGMDRFYNTHESEGANAITGTVIRAEYKEDGTLIHLFYYANRWHIATRYNFGEDFVPNGMTFEQLFESVKKLDTVSNLDPNLTYCLELCSVHNIIIRPYAKPQLFLITAFQNGVETLISEVDQIATKAGFDRPLHVMVKDVHSARKLLEIRCKEDPLFEGFVLRDEYNNRLKLKNDFYRVVHKLKYRGWIVASPHLIGPFIFRKATQRLSESLSQYKTYTEMQEYIKRIDFYQNVFDQAQTETRDVIEKYCEMPFMESIREINQMKIKHLGIIIEVLKKCNGEKSKVRDVLDEAWTKSEGKILETVFKLNSDPFIDHQHPQRYCKMRLDEIEKNSEDNGVAKIKPENRDELGKWLIYCYCGSEMKLTRLRSDLLQYKTCHCGSNFTTHIYDTGLLIYTCTDKKCPLTHDCYQENDFAKKAQPTGIPASSRCKNLRLYCHELLSEWGKLRGYDKNESYQKLSELIRIERKDCHMGLFDIPMCKKVIHLLQMELDKE